MDTKKFTLRKYKIVNFTTMLVLVTSHKSLMYDTDKINVHERGIRTYVERRAIMENPKVCHTVLN